MKILHVADSLDIGGGEKMCVQLANLFSKNNFEVGIVYFRKTPNNFINSINNNVKVHFIKKQLWNPLFYAKVAKLLNKYDIIHVHLTSPIKVVYVSDWLFNIKSSKIIFHTHTGSKLLFELTAKDKMLHKAIKKYIYVAVHDELKILTQQLIQSSNPDMYVISNFVSKPPFVKLKTKTQPNGCIDLMVLGNIKEQKNQLFLIPLLKALTAKGEKDCVHVCGQIHDKEYYKQLVDEAAKNNLSVALKFHHQFEAFNQINLTVDMALMISKDESGPLVNIEYILMHVPFLTHDVGDVTKIIKQVIPLQVIPNLNADFWADKIIAMHAKPFNADAYSLVYENNFSEKVAFKKWLDLYTSEKKI